MISLDAAFITSAAPNADAAKNGRGLVLKNKFINYHHSPDETLLFAQCQGSGKDAYLCSCDFAEPEKPVYRCSCPSRQFPCKHSLGLMYALVEGKKFTSAEIPEDIARKRDKVQQRTEKKKETAEKPKTVNKGALAKKIKAQLDGIALLEKLTHELVRVGIGNMNAKLAGALVEQAKQLGNAYLPGAQAALHRYSNLFTDESGKYAQGSAAGQAAVYTEALDQLTRLHALIKQGRQYLDQRLADPELAPEAESGIAAWLGHAWQLSELKAIGLVESNAELAQLAFNTYDDRARKEYIDTGVWFNLKTGKIQLTQTYRPYKAAKYIKSEDSCFQVLCVPELCIYPGEVNPRIRWEGHTARPLDARDLKTIRTRATLEFAAAIKEVKNLLKSPLAERQPIFALQFKRLGKVAGNFVLEDTQGERLVLADAGQAEEPPSCQLLPLLPKSALNNQTMIVRFRHDLDTRQLRVKPLSIVTESNIVRLTL